MAATDDYVGMQPFAQLGSCRSGAAVTPNDSTDLPNVSRAVFVGGAGNLNVILGDGTTVLLTGVIAGSWLWLAVSRVKSTSTTATNIAAFY